MKQGLFVICLFGIVLSCGPKEVKKDVSTTPSQAVDGAKIFKQNCEICHGADGKLGANGSKDLTVSEYDLNERIAMITKGKGVMMAFESILSLAEIKAVAEYSMTLK